MNDVFERTTLWTDALLQLFYMLLSVYLSKLPLLGGEDGEQKSLEGI